MILGTIGFLKLRIKKQLEKDDVVANMKHQNVFFNKTTLKM
ncbi:hypothetical protein V2P72_01915 [Mesomycoplasma hyopneumoniae]